MRSGDVIFTVLGDGTIRYPATELEEGSTGGEDPARTHAPAPGLPAFAEGYRTFAALDSNVCRGPWQDGWWGRAQ